PGGMQTQARVDELAQDQREVINNWPPDDPSFDEFLSDLVIEAEVEMQMAWNPVRRKINEFQDHLMRHDRKLSWSPRLLSMPEEHRTDYRQENSRIRAGTFGASGSVEQVGNQVSVHTSKGDVTEIAWIRTVPDWLTASIIGDEIAQLLAFKRAAGLFDDPLRRSA